MLGDRLVDVYDQVHPHVQDEQVDECIALAAERNVNALIGMGGGSAIGMAKAIASRLGEMRNDHLERTANPTVRPVVPIIAIPTTYAGSEMTAVYGITHTHETPPRKVTFNDPKIAPLLVIYDPELTISLPAELTASTGLTPGALHQALYSVKRHPIDCSGDKWCAPHSQARCCVLLYPRG
jgi:alcohol dehydrogenase class IV